MLRDFCPYISFGCFITSMYNLAPLFSRAMLSDSTPLRRLCLFSPCMLLSVLSHTLTRFHFYSYHINTLMCFFFSSFSCSHYSLSDPLFLIPTSFSSSLYQMSYPLSLSLPSSILLFLSLSQCASF